MRIRRGSSKAGKYGKQRSPEKIKTDEYSERDARPEEREREGRSEGEVEGGKADRGKERERFQANWKNTEGKKRATTGSAAGVQTLRLQNETSRKIRKQ